MALSSSMLARALRSARISSMTTRSIRLSSSSSSPKPAFADDPFPLPLSSASFAEQEPIPQDLMPTPLPRPNESLDALRGRLVYQSRKRGTLESDLLLSTFAKENLPTMSIEELKQFDKLMDEPDWDLYYWAIEKRAPPERWQGSPLLEKLKVHARNEGKVVRRMPDIPEVVGRG